MTKRRVEGGTTEATQPRRLQRTASPKGIVCPRQRHERGGKEKKTRTACKSTLSPKSGVEPDWPDPGMDAERAGQGIYCTKCSNGVCHLATAPFDLTYPPLAAIALFAGTPQPSRFLASPLLCFLIIPLQCCAGGGQTGSHLNSVRRPFSSRRFQPVFFRSIINECS